MDVVTLSKIYGGLGIKKLSVQNGRMLKKGLWKFCSEDLTLWRRFLSHKYGLQNNWMTEEVTMLFGLFKNVNRCVSDAPKVEYSWRTRYGCGIKSEESELSKKKKKK